MTKQKGQLKFIPPNTDKLLAEYHAMRNQCCSNALGGHIMTIIPTNHEMKTTDAYCCSMASQLELSG
jgi:hypothetical protein